ncbi:MAG: sodium:solute symporter family protein [Planctomycetota bacterium]|jgi:SSS family solute:Na+ symporter|nr:sodium:solute symporter family protein [Planctomycetota bacterium]
MLSLLLQHVADGGSDAAANAAAAAGASPIFWFIVLGYFAVVLGFGSYFAKFNKSTSDFFFGGRRFSWWLITMSIVATGVGSHSFLKYSGKSFEHGFSGSMAYMNDWFFMPLFIFGWLPIIYYMKVRSIPEYFERRFSAKVRALATAVLLMYMLGYVGIGLLTMAKTLGPILGDSWSLMEIIWVVATVAGVYITFGGQTAVIFTDLLQGFILLFAGLILFALGLNWLGGFSEFWNSLPAEFKLPLANFNDDPGFNFVGIFWQDAVAGSIGFLFMNQGLVMRFLACRSVHDGRKAAAFNILFALPISAIAVSCAGWIGYSMMTQDPTLVAPDSDPDTIFVIVTRILTTKAGFGFFVAAVTAALMSTVDTLINAISAVFLNDIYQPLNKRRGIQRDDKHNLKVAMIASAAATFVGVAAAWGFSLFDNLYEAHGFFHSTFTPPLVACIFMGIFWRRFNTKGALATFIAGTIMIILGRVLPHELIGPISHGIPTVDPETGEALSTPFKYIGALYNLIVCFGSGIIVTLLTSKDDKPLEGLTMFSLGAARALFKGGKPNDRIGFAQTVTFELDTSLPPGAIRMDAEAMHHLAAEQGDLAYICDKRKWLGGLRSAHGHFDGVHQLGETVLLSQEIYDSGHFLAGKLIVVEKEF